MNAAREVASKSSATIDRETARTWAARAVACYRHAAAAKTAAAREKWLVRAVDFEHEALEHAGTVGDHGKFAGRIQRVIERAKKVAKRKTKRRRG